MIGSVGLAAAQFALFKAYNEDEKLNYRWAALLWISAGLGILIKGPVLPMVFGLTTVTLCVLDRDTVWLRRLRLHEPRVAGIR